MASLSENQKETGHPAHTTAPAGLVLLDGATGTELARRGVPLPAPLWTARAVRSEPETVVAIHKDYVAAGADVITACTFRTQPYVLRKAGLHSEQQRLTGEAVGLAKAAAAGNGDIAVAGSLASLEDCYRPDLTPPNRVLAAEHARMAELLADAGVDLILVETQPTVREAVAATAAAVRTGLATWVSMVCRNSRELLSGESLLEAVEEIRRLEPAAILVNCLPARCGLAAVRRIQAAAPDLVLGIYANTGELLSDAWVSTVAESPAVYARMARQWRTAGASIVGGCCGTTPEHIERLAKTLR